MKRYLLILMGAVVAPILTAIFLTRYAYMTGTPPFDPDWPMVSIVAGLAMGIISIAQLPVRGATRRFAILAVYLPVMTILLWMLAYMTGCFSGDC